MTPQELANWEKIRDQMEISGKTDSFFYRRAVAICDGKEDPMKDLPDTSPASLDG